MKSLLQFCVLVLLLGSVLPCVAAPSLVDHYRKALDADPQNQTLRYHLGVALLNQGENRLALKAFRSAYAQRADEPEINFNLALAYTRLNDPDSALIYLDQALASGAGGQPEIYPLQNVYFNLVLVYEQLGQLDAAVLLLQRLVSENPASHDYLRLLGDYQLRLGQVDKAIDVFDDYLQQRPEDSEVRQYAFASIFNRGLAAYVKQDFPGARHEFSRALKFAGESPLVFYYLALLDYQQKNYQRAAERLPAVYEDLNDDLKSSARSILYNTALSLKSLKMYLQAQQALEPLIAVARPRPKDLALLAGIQLEIGAYDSARQNYLRVLQADPGHGSVVEGIRAAERGAFEEILVAVVEAFATGDLPAVRKQLERAAQIYPEDNRLRIYQSRLARAAKENWLGFQAQAKTLEEQQQYVEALTLLRKGLRLSPAEPLLLRHEKRLVVLLSERIAVLYRQGRDLYTRGELQLARTNFEQLVLLSPEHRDGKEFLRKIDIELQQQAQRAVGAGEAALARDELLEARHDFERALAVWPAEGQAKEGLAWIEKMLSAKVAEALVRARRARAEGRLQAAAELLEEARQRWPAAALEAELSRVRDELTQWQKNIAQLTRTAIQLQQFNKAAQLLARADRLDSGLIDFTQLNKQLDLARVQEVERQLDLARQEVTAENFDSGLKAYRRALDIDPENAEALAGLKRGRAELSSTIIQGLVEGATAHQAGRFDLARQAYRRVLNLDPHQAEALKALRQIERAGRAGLTSADSRRLYLAGIELYTEGDYKQAIATWRQVLDLDPAHEKAKMNIDKAERKLSQIRERQSG